MTSTHVCSKERIIFLTGPVADEVASVICAPAAVFGSGKSQQGHQFLHQLSRGRRDLGYVDYDTMQYIRPDVATLCVGQAASMGSLLLAGGAKGKRYALPNARIMVHQPSGGFQGQATDIEIHAQEILKIRARLNEIYAEHTGQPVEPLQMHSNATNFTPLMRLRPLV